MISRAEQSMERCNQGTHFQQGLTLVELLIALGLGIILSSGVITLYLESSRNYTLSEELARLQENGRYAINQIKREIAMAGFFSGLSDIPTTSVSVDCGASNWATDTRVPVEFIDNFSASLVTSNGTTLTCIDAATVQANTDIITIKRFADRPTLRNGNWSSGVSAASTTQLYVRTKENSDASWSFGAIDVNDVVSGSEVDYWSYFTKVFFVRDYSETAGDNIPSLCVASLQSNAMQTDCLVEGIEEIQVEFGIDSNSDGYPDQFTATPTAADLVNSVVLRIYLLVRSVNTDSNYIDNKTYNLGSRVVSGLNDNYYRRVFTTTVVLKNRDLL